MLFRSSDDDGDGATPSSPGRSQPGMYSGGDVPMTDQTDDDGYEVFTFERKLTYAVV